MKIFTIPKQCPYVVKRDCIFQVQNSKTSQTTKSEIKHNAELFRKNNLVTIKALCQ